MVIPVGLRRRFAIRTGTCIFFREEGGRIILQPVTAEFVRHLRGSLGKGPSVLKKLLGDRGRERHL